MLVPAPLKQAKPVAEIHDGGVKTRFQDVFWIAVASAVIFAVFVGVLSLFSGRADPVKLLVGIVPGTWLALGCWRRTKWGAPEGGLREAQERRATGAAADDDER